MLTIVLTGGGSGGHITPLLPLARALKKLSPNCRVVYFGLKGDKLSSLQDEYKVFDKVYLITSGKFRRYHGQSWLATILDIKTIGLNLIDFFKVLAGIVRAWRLLGRVKPQVVFSKGGYVAVPVGIAAHLHRLPIVTHDSDAVPGLANRIIGRWAAAHAAGTPPGAGGYQRPDTVYTGIPINEHASPVNSTLRTAYKAELGLDKDSLVLLVGGAGLGARTLNEKVAAVAAELLTAHPQLHIINITGSRTLETTSKLYQDAVAAQDRARVRLLDFTPEFYKYTGAADLVVTRAGATTLAELAAQHKAAVLVPAPFLTGGHQTKNAEALAATGAAAVVNNDIAPKDLLNVINDLLNNRQQRRNLEKKIGSLARPEAAEELARLILKVAGIEEGL